MSLAKHAAESNKLFAMNLSAPFLPQFFTKVMDEAAPYWDIIFGNEAEFEAWAVAHNYENPKDLKSVALQVSKLPKVGKRDRVVVVTQGSDPVIVAYKGEVKEYDILKLEKEKIIDTNGAGGLKRRARSVSEHSLNFSKTRTFSLPFYPPLCFHELASLVLFTGDAFVGGFLSRLVLGQSIDKCVAAGNYVASVVIQRNGATYPRTKPEYDA